MTRTRSRETYACRVCCQHCKEPPDNPNYPVGKISMTRISRAVTGFRAIVGDKVDAVANGVAPASVLVVSFARELACEIHESYPSLNAA